MLVPPPVLFPAWLTSIEPYWVTSGERRSLLQAAAFNLALILRSITTAGTPKGLADLKRKVVLALLRVLAALWALPAPIFGVYETSAIRSSLSDRVRPNPPKLRPSGKSRF